MSKEESVDAASMHPIVHTPGPWECKRLIDNTGKPYATLYESHIDIGQCMIWAPPGNAEQEANARLIASSPEMFRIIQRLATADWIGEAELNLWRKECREIMRKVV